jgi:hypothetical protein
VRGKSSRHTADTIADGLVVERSGSGKEFGDGAHFDCTLIVILFGERPESAARLVEFSKQNQQVQKIRDRRVSARMAQHTVADQDDQPVGFRQYVGGLCPLGAALAGRRLQGLPRGALQSGSQTLHEGGRLLRDGGIDQVAFDDGLDDA